MHEPTSRTIIYCPMHDQEYEKTGGEKITVRTQIPGKGFYYYCVSLLFGASYQGRKWEDNRQVGEGAAGRVAGYK